MTPRYEEKPTQIDTDEGPLYLATTDDLFSRRMLGYATSAHHDAALVVASLSMAATTRGGGSSLASTPTCPPRCAVPPARRAGGTAPGPLARFGGRGASTRDVRVATAGSGPPRSAVMHGNRITGRAERTSDIRAVDSGTGHDDRAPPGRDESSAGSHRSLVRGSTGESEPLPRTSLDLLRTVFVAEHPAILARRHNIRPCRWRNIPQTSWSPFSATRPGSNGVTVPPLVPVVPNAYRLAGTHWRIRGPRTTHSGTAD
jgi:hypothetical protein